MVTKILTAQQMREIDRLTVEAVGLPSLLLMENAAMNLFSILMDRFTHLNRQRIAVICGKGNNGGDGIALARQLIQRGITPDVYLLGSAAQISGDARTNLDIYFRSGQRVQEVTSSSQWTEISARLRDFNIIIDAILGTGINKPLDGLYSEVVSSINSSFAFVLSVDIPSGMFSDSVQGGVQTVRANATVTFTAFKLAHILNENQAAIGELHLAPIGTPAKLLDRPDFYLELISPQQAYSSLLPRPTSSHKGNFGHVAIISGSQGKAGAAVLSSHAALRAGAGLVTGYTPDLIQQLVASSQPEIMTQGFPGTAGGTFSAKAATPVLNSLQDKDAAGLGPGLTTDEETVCFVHQLVQNARIPLVLDADALNAFAGQSHLLANQHQAPLIITPHPGEFSRLTGLPIREVLARKVELSRQFARKHGLWVVLKTFRTLVASPSGQVFVCAKGNPGMATAGMGDVLTGVLTSVIGLFAARKVTQPQDITKAVSLGVYLHALAGDLAVCESSSEALIAGDVIRHLGSAYREISKPENCAWKLKPYGGLLLP